MYVRHPKNTLHILEVCSIYLLSPTAVKHTCFIDPSRIAVQNSHIMLINTWYVFKKQKQRLNIENGQNAGPVSGPFGCLCPNCDYYSYSSTWCHQNYCQYYVIITMFVCNHYVPKKWLNMIVDKLEYLQLVLHASILEQFQLLWCLFPTIHNYCFYDKVSLTIPIVITFQLSYTILPSTISIISM